MHRPLLLIALVVGCGASAPPASSATSQTTAVAPTDACANAGGLVLVVPDAVPASWSGALILGGRGTVALRWCGSGVIAIDRLHLDSGHGGSAEWEFDPAVTRLAHGESVTREVTGSAEPSEMQLTATAHDDAGHVVTATATLRSVSDPEFVAQRDACLAAGGTFAPAGLAQTFACDRPTHDAGRRCLSSGECEGACIDDHTEVTTNAPDGRACPAGQELRLHVGACAATTLHFGCSPLLMEVLTECATPGMASRRHTVCVD